MPKITQPTLVWDSEALRLSKQRLLALLDAQPRGWAYKIYGGERAKKSLESTRCPLLNYRRDCIHPGKYLCSAESTGGLLAPAAQGQPTPPQAPGQCGVESRQNRTLNRASESPRPGSHSRHAFSQVCDFGPASVSSFSKRDDGPSLELVGGASEMVHHAWHTEYVPDKRNSLSAPRLRREWAGQEMASLDSGSFGANSPGAAGYGF